MKRLIVLTFFISMSLGVMAQSKAIMEFHERFKDYGNYVAVKIDGGLLKFLSNVETDDKEGEEVLKALSKLEAIDIHAVERNMEGFDEDYVREFKKSIRKENFDELIGHLKNQEFRKCKEWSVENSSTGFSGLYRKLYDSLQDHLEDDSIPPAIIILADYIYRSEFVNDEELNFTACLTKLMLTCKFK